MAGLAVVAAGIAWLGWIASESRRERRELDRIRVEVNEGRFATASRELDAVLARHPSSEAALYLLGTCAMKSGRPKEAEAAWARVPPDAANASLALLGRVKIRMGRGDYSGAERLLLDLARDPRMDPSTLASVLGPVYLGEGRLVEALRLLESRWEAMEKAGQGASQEALQIVREYIHLRSDPVPVDSIRRALEKAGQLSPNDDRVWLARARLAIRAGDDREAARWLDACLQARPRDHAVWRAEMDRAVASDRLDLAEVAFRHLPSRSASPETYLRWDAWFAARRGNHTAEQQALERLLQVIPSDLAAIDRLAELADRDGRHDEAGVFRRRRTEIEAMTARYRLLYERNQPRRDAAEMGTLALQLGREFEARVYLTRAVAEYPDREDLRGHLNRLRSIAPSGGSLDEAAS